MATQPPFNIWLDTELLHCSTLYVPSTLFLNKTQVIQSVYKLKIFSLNTTLPRRLKDSCNFKMPWTLLHGTLIIRNIWCLFVFSMCITHKKCSIPKQTTHSKLQYYANMPTPEYINKKCHFQIVLFAPSHQSIKMELMFVKFRCWQYNFLRILK